MIDIQAIRPEVILALFAIAVPAVGLLPKSSSKVCAAFSLVGVGLAFADAFLFIDNNDVGVYFDGSLLKLDQFSALFMLIFLAVAFYVILASARFIQEDKHQPEFYSLIMVATVGMMIVASSPDLITLFVGIELTSISSYALVAFRKKDPKGAEAAVKYFIIGGLSSGLTLFGISLFLRHSPYHHLRWHRPGSDHELPDAIGDLPGTGDGRRWSGVQGGHRAVPYVGTRCL